MSAKIHSWSWLVVGAVLLLAPSEALACPVCIDPSGASRSAYLGTTILLSLLPIGFVFGLGMVVRAMLRAQEREERVTG